MSDIRQWLADLELDQYADAFEQNEIDIQLLPRLSDETLEKLGVSVIGHRIRLLDAIASLVDIDGLAAGHTPVKQLEQDGKLTSTEAEAENRQLTIMFCDLVDSTGLSEKLDAEDLRELLGVYQKTVGAVIARFDGHIAQYLGDGIMAYFGWPHAHEEDAERAIRAAMEIVNAVPEMRATEFLLKEPLRVRIGVATGPVVLGETGSGDAAVPKAAVGTTPNEAARLQGLAGPNEIVISPITRQLAGRAFDYDDMGEQRPKGISAPVRPWRVLSENTGTNRFKARAEDKLLPLVGRDSEIRMLLARWREARRGDGQVIMLSGEPGIGKSRVIFEFQQRLDANLPVLTYQCSPFYTNTALHPFVGYFERAAGFKRYPTALLRTQLE